MKTAFFTSGKFSLLLMLAMSATTLLHAQQLQYDIKEDKHWIDSIKKVIYRHDPDTNFGSKSLLKYFNSCIALGKYYELLYYKGKIQSTRKAVYYYENVAVIGRVPDEVEYHKVLAIRNTVCRKLGAIYFYGMGIKANRTKSLDFALKGTSGYPAFFKSYSKRYFGNTRHVYKIKTVQDYKSDTIFSFKINPFVFQSNLFNIRSMGKYLEKITNSFDERFKHDTTFYIVVNVSSQTSMRSQGRAGRVVDVIRNFFIYRRPENKKRVICNYSIGEEPEGNITIYFTKFPPM
ncbi:hypothetical protein [Ferruginibacter sp.]